MRDSLDTARCCARLAPPCPLPQAARLDKHAPPCAAQGRRTDDDERQIGRWKGVAGLKGRWKRSLVNKARLPLWVQSAVGKGAPVCDIFCCCLLPGGAHSRLPTHAQPLAACARLRPRLQPAALLLAASCSPLPDAAVCGHLQWPPRTSTRIPTLSHSLSTVGGSLQHATLRQGSGLPRRRSWPRAPRSTTRPSPPSCARACCTGELVEIQHVPAACQAGALRADRALHAGHTVRASACSCRPTPPPPGAGTDAAARR